FEQSWKLLSEDERSVLAPLSVFRGGFDLEAAERVASATLPTLASLADKSLIRMSRSGRYDLHELLRQFASDKLAESGQMVAINDGHLNYCLSLAEQAEAHLYGPTQEIWFDCLEIEHDNIGAALAWSLNDGRAEPGLRLAGALGFFWQLRTHEHEASTWMQKLLANMNDVPTAVQAKVLRVAGMITLEDWDHARFYCEESLRLARAIGDKSSIAWALGTL